MKRLLWIFVGLIAAPVLGEQSTGTPGAPPPGNPAGVSAPAPIHGKTPKVYFAKSEFQFGNVEEGPDITHLFYFRNRGKAKLVINNVSTSCGCTAAVGSAKEIPPGGVGNIKVTYHTSGRPGPATKIITVTSNDPANPSVQLKMEMTVVREVDIQPDHVYMYGVRKGENRSSPVRILGKPGVPLKVLSAESAMHIVDVSMAPLTDDAQKKSGATVTVSLPVTQGIGMFTDTVKVKTDSAKKPELEIQVIGEVVGRVTYNPKQFTFQAHQDMPVTLQLTANPAQGFAIRNVESLKHLARPYIKKTPGPDGIDQYQLIVSTVKRLPKDSDGKDEVDIYTNDKEQSKIVIPVTIATQ